MFKEPYTTQEKRAVKFGVELLTKHGYGHTIHTPVMEMTEQLKGKGVKISHPTVMQYLQALERMGYAKREMRARMFGVTYRLNRYKFNKLINTMNDEQRV